MADIPKLNEAAFEAEVLKSPLPVMVDFTAVWCGPCKMLDPVVTQLSQDWAGKVKFVKLDVDDNSNLAVQYGVMGVPTLILFVNGNVVQRLSGYQPKDRIISKFGSFI
jgi:thioredoxin 1